MKRGFDQSVVTSEPSGQVKSNMTFARDWRTRCAWLRSGAPGVSIDGRGRYTFKVMTPSTARLLAAALIEAAEAAETGEV